MRLTAITTAAAAVALTAMSGCVVAPYPHYPYGYPQQGPQYGGDAGVVMEAPPAQQYEVVPVAPFVGAVWIGGFWNWTGGRHVWVGGHWEHPRPGYRYVPHRWEPVARGGGWRAVPGRWERG